MERQVPLVSDIADPVISMQLDVGNRIAQDPIGPPKKAKSNDN